VRDGRDGGGERALAGFLRAKRTFRIDTLDDERFDLWRFGRRGAAIFEQAGVHQHAVLPDHFFLESLAHAHPDPADNLAFSGNRVKGAAAIVRGPALVDSDFARVFVDAYLRDLSRIRICRGRADASALVFAPASVGRRSVGSRSAEGTMEIDSSNHGLFKGH